MMVKKNIKKIKIKKRTKIKNIKIRKIKYIY